jgi:hypothetical protein
MKKTIVTVCIVAVALFTASYAVKGSAIDSDFWWSIRHPSAAMVLATSTNIDERMRTVLPLMDDPPPWAMRQAQMFNH